MVRVFLCVFAFGFALSANAASDTQSTPEQALQILVKMQAAARKLDYAGVITYQQGNRINSSRVVHLVDGTGERERIELLDGNPHELIRHNETARSLLPDHKLVIIEPRLGERFPSLFLRDEQQVLKHYDAVLLSETARVAGRECRVVLLKPHDQERYGRWLCVDKKSNLLLKLQTLSLQGDIIDQVVFVSIVLGKAAASEQVTASWDTSEWTVIDNPVKEVNLSEKGWRIPYPPGFEMLVQMSRPLPSQTRVNQLVLSDGLASISVFVEPFDSHRHAMSDQGSLHKGVLSVFRKRVGDHWLTVVGQVPAETLKNIGEHVEYVPLLP